MPARTPLKSLLYVLAVSIPSVSFANDIVVAPLYTSSVEAKVVSNVSSLIASELDFMGEVSSVIELDARPSNLGPNCLKSTSCLGGITSSSKGSQLFTGTMSASSGSYTLDLLLYDKPSNTILRRKSFTLKAEAEAVANGMTPIIREILTGQSSAKEAEQAHADSDFAFSDEDDLDFLAPSANERQAQQRTQEEAARRRAAEEAQRREEERRRAEEEARRRAEEEARRRAEEEARKRAEEEARRQAAEEEAERARARESSSADFDEMDDFDPSLISFGSAMATVDEDEEFLEDLHGLDSLDDFEDEEEYVPGLMDLDTDQNDRRSSKSGNSNRNSYGSQQDDGRISRGGSSASHGTTIRARMGLTKYYSFNFVVTGVDLALPLGQSGAYLTGSFNAFSVQRELPEEFREDGRLTEWNTIYPIGGGLIYKVNNTNTVQPFVGGEFIAVQYYKDDVGSDWAAGIRGRGGIDIMATPNFGINLEAHLGYWTGPTLNQIDSGVKNSGTLPGFVGGASISF